LAAQPQVFDRLNKVGFLNMFQLSIGGLLRLACCCHNLIYKENIY